MSDNDTPIDIYRKQPIEKTSPEHILQAGLGCDLSRRNLIGADLNAGFGGTIDRDLLTAFELFRVLLGLQSRRGRDLDTESTDPNMALSSGGVPKLTRRGKPWTVQELEDGTKKVTVIARTVEEAIRLRDHALKAEGDPELAPKNERAVQRREYPEQMEFQLALGGPVHARAIAKSAFNFAAMVLGSDEVLKPCFDELRSYVLEGVDDYDRISASTHVDTVKYANWDTRDLIPTFEPRLGSALEHRILLRASAETRTVYAVVDLFGSIRFSVLLSSEWDGPDRAYALFANPVPGEQRNRYEELDVDKLPALSADAVLAHDLVRDEAGEAIGAAGRELMGLNARQTTRELTDAVAEEVFGDKENYTPEELQRFISVLAERFTNQFLRIPEEHEIDLKKKDNDDES